MKPTDNINEVLSGLRQRTTMYFYIYPIGQYIWYVTGVS